MKTSQFFWKNEKYFFGILILLFLIPVIVSKFFPTMDGPAHLYNGHLLNQLWFHGSPEVFQFFDVNTHTETNWINHIWFAFMFNFFPAFIVEKSFLILYIVTLVYSFRRLIITLAGKSKQAFLASYLIFPFVYSFPFCMGFFNFCIGIPILFVCVTFWVNTANKWNAYRIIMLLFLTSLLYLTHLFNFLFFGLIIFVFEAKSAINSKEIKSFFRQLLFLFITTLPGILFTSRFVFSNNGEFVTKYLSTTDLIKGLTDMSPLITLSYNKEKTFSQIILFCVVILILIVVYNIFKDQQTKKNFKSNSFWLIIAFLMLILYFTVPDWMLSGGGISIRLALFFFLIIIIWIATIGLSVKQLFFPLSIILGSALYLVYYHTIETKTLSEDAAEMASAANYIEEGKTLLPLNYSQNWLHSNYSNYIGAEKFIVVLDNYEATTAFPLLWKKNENPCDLIGNFGNLNPCITIEKYEKQTGHRIDYITRWCFNKESKDSCSTETERLILQNFEFQNL